MKFVQIVEFKTDKIDEMAARGRQYEQETGGGGTAMVCADRDKPGSYLIIATFPLGLTRFAGQPDYAA